MCHLNQQWPKHSGTRLEQGVAAGEHVLGVPLALQGLQLRQEAAVPCLGALVAVRVVDVDVLLAEAAGGLQLCAGRLLELVDIGVDARVELGVDQEASCASAVQVCGRL